MEAILTIATILGGITALWFLWEKLFKFNLVKIIKKWRNVKIEKSFIAQPTENRIVAKVQRQSPWVAGIKIPTSVLEPPNQGIVVAIGEEVRKIKIGQKIFWNKFAYQEIKAGDKLYMMVRENDVLGVIE